MKRKRPAVRQPLRKKWTRRKAREEGSAFGRAALKEIEEKAEEAIREEPKIRDQSERAGIIALVRTKYFKERQRYIWGEVEE